MRPISGGRRGFGTTGLLGATLALCACGEPGGGVAVGGVAPYVPPAVVLPAGARCGPATLPPDPAVAPSDGGGDADAPAASACGDPTSFSPLRPLGVGYPDIPNPLPPHVAYLTFDDGPSEWTNDFLDILKFEGIHATFFVTARQLKGEAGLDGTYVDANGNTVVFRDVLKRETDEGHLIGDHTVNHPDLAAITPFQIRSEIEEDELLINTALVRAGGIPRVLSLFRPPYGSPWYSGVVMSAAPDAADRISSHGLNIMWTVSATDATDWAPGESFSRTYMPTPTPGAPSYQDKMERIRQAVLASPQVAAGEGFIVLMHDTHDTTRDVLVDIIDGLVAAGYSFADIEDYVQWRWQRPSTDLTPGPSLYAPCVAERNWGCASFGVAAGTDSAREVCGRMWLAFQALGGQAVLGSPTAEPSTSPATGTLSQRFEHAIVELHPENPAPCNVVVIPQ